MNSLPTLQTVCQQYHGLLIEETEQTLRIALQRPPTEQIFSAFRAISHKALTAEIWPAEQMAIWQTVCSPTPNQGDSDYSLTDLLNEVLNQAILQQASDIHFEPGPQTYRIRLRLDGVLHALPLLPATVAAQITARLKVLAELDIAEKRLPQDGQMDFQHQENRVSFRISTLPCRYGEKLVLRLLQQATQTFDIEALGMSEQEHACFTHALSSPQGLILITGPTGSGKTLSLYSALARLNQVHRNICTVEDPVEIPVAGLNQTQLHPKAGLTYSTLLRALLRQDPDVIMIGEIRDAETAEMAVKAAQTGHLVLSTLHTESTLGTLARLEQLNIPRAILVSSLRLIVSQRLVRKLCPLCRVPYKDTSKHSHASAIQTPHWQAKGCSQCYGGYLGRTALFEMLPVSEALSPAMIQSHSLSELQAVARTCGMTTLLENGYSAVAQGVTSQEELHRVLGSC